MQPYPELNRRTERNACQEIFDGRGDCAVIFLWSGEREGQGVIPVIILQESSRTTLARPGFLPSQE